MRIGCLQFAPQVGDVDNNLNRADAVLSRANPKNLDLLVLPEMAFSGYNYRSLQHISPFLEPTTSGISSLWARTTALKHNCVVMVGYPEKVDVSVKWPSSPEYYNSAIVVNADGETIANYRKSFLYYTDETWALEGPDGFYDEEIQGLGNVAMGICKWPTNSFERMDLNPYKFEAPWNAWEFSYHILHRESNLVVLSMAWLTREDARSYSRSPKDPDMETLSYWLARLEPVIRAEGEGEIIVVLANRCGTEEEAVYAGTSAVLGIQSGEVNVYGILGRGEKELLIVDTKSPPQAKLVSLPNSPASNLSDTSTVDSTFSRESQDSSLTVDTLGSFQIDVGEFPQSMAEIMTPPICTDPGSPQSCIISKNRRRVERTPLHDFRSNIPENEPVNPFNNCLLSDLTTLKDELKSRFPESEAIESSFPEMESIEASLSKPISPAREISPTLPSSSKSKRPTSPKSRNTSRTRLHEEEQQQPALHAHDNATEDQGTLHSVDMMSTPWNDADVTPPHLTRSAADAPDRNKYPFTGASFRATSLCFIPRPRSAVF